MDNIKIDLVYLWVDGNDPQWLKKKQSYLQQSDSNFTTEMVSDCRYIENDELKYSLRSVELYAPWINKIYIVTDGQTPSWLDTTSRKVEIIDHKQIIPNEVLPMFNSTAIEMCLANIPGLSEHFLFSNDDMLFAKPTPPEFFFNKDGHPKIRFKKRTLLYYKYKKNGNYAQIVYSSILKIREEFGQTFRVSPHHCVDAYNRSNYQECLDHYGQWRDKTLKSRFREFGDLHRTIVSLYALVKGKGDLVYVNKYNNISGLTNKVKAYFSGQYASDSRGIHISSADISKIMKKYDPYVFCLNDNHKATQADRDNAKAYLEARFSNKSCFEK